MAQAISIQDAVDLIEHTGGRIFSAVFTKKDGSTREMTCRRGVKKGVTGKGLRFDALSRGLIPVFDMTKETEGNRGAFRMLNLGGLRRLRVNGETFEVVPG